MEMRVGELIFRRHHRAPLLVMTFFHRVHSASDSLTLLRLVPRFRYALSADTQGMMCFWDITEAKEINSVKVTDGSMMMLLLISFG
jgi:hypothetical protein